VIGSTVSHYRILEKLGAGGMGEVYLAEDTKLDRKVALKFLPASLRKDAEARERLLREARATSKLDHPNILTVYDVRLEADNDFIVMAYVDGQSLADYTMRKSSDLQQTLDVALQVARGLKHAHDIGIVHRDLKPSNILVDASGRARILDFGLAKIRGYSKLTQTGSTVGTIAYAAPEVAEGGEAGARSDIFSYGVMLYELVAGALPFPGEHEAAIVYAIMHEQPRRLSEHRGDVPDALQDIVDRCLAKPPAERYASCAELVADLEAVCSGSASPAAHASKIPSIAVLPFTNMSADPENEYFSDGLAEDLINALTNLGQLRVVSRTSSFAFRGKETDIREIGRKLSVDTVLEGSVRKAGKRLRITAQLVNVKDGYHLWSERFDREMEDIFAIQDEISQAIVDALKITLVGAAEGSKIRRPTENIEAYNLALRGRYFWSKRTERGLQKAIECYEQAIALDAGYAPAHVGLADCYCLLAAYHIKSPAESMPQARAAAATAMKLDPKLAEAWEAKGHVRLLDDWNWTEAEREYRKAVELNAAYATAHQRLALLLCLSGRFDDARQEIGRARELEPLSLIISADVGLVSYMARDFERALEQCLATLDTDPSFGVAHFIHGLTLEQLGRFEDAIAAFDRAKNNTGGIAVTLGALGHAHAKAGDADEARFLLEEAREMAERRFVSPYSLATIHLGLGETDAALDCLERAVREKSVWLIHLHMKTDPRLDSLRIHPRLDVLMKTAGF
jgi:serine/threonine protein kinase/Flp pilus assembly protein TadD